MSRPARILPVIVLSQFTGGSLILRQIHVVGAEPSAKRDWTPVVRGRFDLETVAEYNRASGKARIIAFRMILVYRELAVEHKELMSLVAEAEAFTSADGIQSVLERLHELLIRHFSREQFPNGLYERMGAHGPKWHPQLRVLVRDHCLILSGIRAMSERASRPGAGEDPSFITDLAEVIAHLRLHEQREHELAERLMALDAPARERA